MGKGHPPPAVVNFTGSPLEVGRATECHVCLPDRTVSRRHATVTPGDGGIAIVDHDSRFGTFVNGVPVRTVLARPGDKVRFGNRIVYRVQPDRLTLETSGGGIALSVERLAVGTAQRTLLNDLTFDVAPDCFAGIIGPSGSGKTTLLNCLASYYHPRSGRLVFDGDQDVRTNLDEYREALGYVPQRDVVYRSLSVRENLLFAARLRMSGQDAAERLENHVAEILEIVGLTEHAETPAGRISGGQCKRLGVALELLRHPRLLLLDEPTSGLDPASETSLMFHLRKVASRGTTVLCTTHLLGNAHLFDHLVVLGVVPEKKGGASAAGVGRLAYCGPSEGLLEHFGERTHEDVFERLMKGDFKPIRGTAGARRSATSK